MNPTTNDQEMDAFFDWLMPLLPPSSFQEPLLPSQQLLDLAWETTQSHHNYLSKMGFYHETIIPLAAGDGSHRSAAMTFDSLGGDWSLTREDIPDDKEWQILKFKCRSGLINEYQGRSVKVVINDELYDLGKVNRRGVAEVEIPYGLDFQQPQDIYLGKPVE